MSRPRRRSSGKMSSFCLVTAPVNLEEEETFESMCSNISDTEMPLAATPANVCIPPVTLLPVSGARKFTSRKS